MLIEQPVARAVPQERAMRQIGQARLQVPLGIQAFDRQRIAVEQGDKGNRVLTLHGMRGGNIPFAVVLFDRQRMLRIRLLRLQRLQPLSAAADICLVCGQDQVAAGRANEKARFAQITVAAIVFRKRATEQRGGIHPQGGAERGQQLNIRRAAACFPHLKILVMYECLRLLA